MGIDTIKIVYISIIMLVFIVIVGVLFVDRTPGTFKIQVERPESISGKQLGRRFPVVRVSLDGVEGLFLLDTGSTHTVLKQHYAERVGVKSIAHISGDNTDGEIVEGSVLGDIKLKNLSGEGGVKIKHPLVMDLGPLNELEIDGVLSPQSLLKKGKVEINFRENELIYFGGRNNLTEELVFDYEDKSLADEGIVRPIVQIGASDQDDLFSCLVDTGASKSVLGEADVDRSIDVTVPDQQGVQSINGESKVYKLSNISLNIGRFATRPMDLLVQPEVDVCKLGMDVLSDSIISLAANGKIGIQFYR